MRSHRTPDGLEHACIDRAVLSLMLDIGRRKQRLVITAALNRLDGAGLIERRGGRAIPSEVARRLDELMTL